MHFICLQCFNCSSILSTYLMSKEKICSLFFQNCRYTRLPFWSLRTGINMSLESSGFVMVTVNTIPEKW